MKTLTKLLILFIAVLAVSSKNLRFRRLAHRALAASEAEFPYQVSIQRDGNHHCGGALISTRHVLTAAHCVHDTIISPEPASIKAQRMIVEVGSTRIGGGIKHAISRVSQIGSYDAENPQIMLRNDIAVITLRVPVTKSEKVRVIGLPTPGAEVRTNSKAIVSGFGSHFFQGPSSNILKKSAVFIVNMLECNQFYIRALRKQLTKGHLCAQNGPGDGTCSGDSGGPLVVGNTVIGVVSAGRSGQCHAGHPDLYTKVSAYMPYIQYELRYNPKRPTVGPSPALALDFKDVPKQTKWHLPSQNNMRFMDPYTGKILPAGSVTLVDAQTGQPITPLTQQFPHIPLYPLGPDTVYVVSG